MIHLTINTDHSRHSPRSEVSDEAISACMPLLASGEHDVPGMDGYRLVVPVCAEGWVGTVYRGEMPLATIGVANTAVAAGEVWPGLERMYLQWTDNRGVRGADFSAPHQPMALPWCSVVLLLPDVAVDWLGDFERCLAWAWLERT